MIDQLEHLRRETESCLRVFYSLKQFRSYLQEGETTALLNKNPEFWQVYEISVRSRLFIGIRRLYEGKNNTFNFQNFINKCIASVDDFSKDKLRKRKLSLGQESTEWIDSYMEGVYEATEEDFRTLSKIVRSNSKRMKGIYSDAASTIYAHGVHMDHAKISQISDQLNFDEMEKALLSIWHCYEQVWQMYLNGQKPLLEVIQYPYKSEVIESLDKQLGLINEIA
ncbi:MAG: hypothetical protein JKX76_14930 [Colwellia sp.]|nr:hypothetical protein [Colwellia sp.]